MNRHKGEGPISSPVGGKRGIWWGRKRGGLDSKEHAFENGPIAPIEKKTLFSCRKKTKKRWRERS